MMMHLGTFAPVAFTSALMQSANGKKAGESSDARGSEPGSEPKPLDPDFGVCMVCFAPCVECLKREADAQSRS